MTRVRVAFGAALGLSLLAFGVSAQAPGPSEAPVSPGGGGPPQGAGIPVVPAPGGGVIVPGGTSTTTVVGGQDFKDPNASLPSSSRPKLGDETDGFDFRGGSEGSSVVSNPGGEAILSRGESRRMAIPPIHLVRRGDTLWDLSDGYYGNPWQWPRIWSQNPQIKNPHWIYPGDQIRMGPGGDGTTSSSFDRLASGPGAGSGTGGDGSGGLVNRRQRLAKDTVILRDQGFLGDPEQDVWGEVAGSQEEQMLLAEGNHVYLLLKPGKSPRPGEQLTVFRTVRKAEDVPGARKPPGEVVAVQGTVRIESVDPKTRVARGLIVESLDVIERGAKIGPVRRRFDVVPPLKNAKLVVARVLTSIYPHVYIGQNQVVFLDRGSEDGLKPGNRLVVMRRGDAWRNSLTAKMAGDRLRTDVSENVKVERTPLPGEQSSFPEEVVAELRVLSTERWSSLALVTLSKRELVVGDVAVARAGY